MTGYQKACLWADVGVERAMLQVAYEYQDLEKLAEVIETLKIIEEEFRKNPVDDLTSVA